MLCFRVNTKTIQVISVIFFGILINEGHTKKPCSGASYSRHTDRRLRCGIFKTLAIKAIDCHKQCTATLNCFSVNTYRSDNGTEICELVRGTKDSFESKKCFVMKSGGEHNELMEINLRSQGGVFENIMKRKALRDEWYQFGSSAFKHFKTKKTWKDANDTCSANKASLAAIDSELENRFVTEVFLKTFQDADKLQAELKPLKYWKLDGTDQHVVLHGGASFAKDANGISAALNLPGSAGSYATTPVVAIQSTSFTIALWVNLYSAAASSYVYSYWASPYIFYFGVISSAIHIQTRKKLNHEADLIFLSGGNVKPNQWTHAVTTWDRATKQVTIYQDGVQVAQRTITDSAVDLRSPTRSVFDVGFQRDSQTVIKGMVRELVVFDRQLTNQEVVLLKDETDFRSKQKIWIGSPELSYNNWVPNLPSSSDCASARAWGQYDWDKVNCKVTMGFVCKKQV